jgi:AraC family transcriptional regulator, regulatory protein of adaptative response / methylated-DNA-[protein]-cysteine methyltransferase
MKNNGSSATAPEIHYAIGPCSLGLLLVAQTARGLCAILLADERGTLVRELRESFPGSVLTAADTGMKKLFQRVAACVEQPARGLDAALDLRGTAFQQKVWKALRSIPAGRTASYTDIARRIHAPASARAVAQACAANVLAVAVPCHRVVRSDGALSGYRWGPQRKAQLLAREGAV